MNQELLNVIYQETIKTVLDLAPIVILAGLFQVVVIRRAVPQLSRIISGLGYVAIGLTLFRIGIDEALIPIGRDMARQLVESAFSTGGTVLERYFPILAFAGLIGLTATLIEPTLIAAATRVEELSGGTLRAGMLRLLVSCGIALGLVLGTVRIITDFPLAYMIAGITVCLIMLALTAPRAIVPLALDSGAIATSVVTVPLIAAYGITVAEAMPNEATAADGFGLIVLALLLPAILLLAFAKLQAWLTRRENKGGSDAV